jgi:hypothetical protein
VIPGIATTLGEQHIEQSFCNESNWGGKLKLGFGEQLDQLQIQDLDRIVSPDTHHRNIAPASSIWGEFHN